MSTGPSLRGKPRNAPSSKPSDMKHVGRRHLHHVADDSMTPIMRFKVQIS